jgi:hypothetical protein
MPSYYVTVIGEHGESVVLYDGGSDAKAKNALVTGRQFFRITKGTGRLNFFNADTMGHQLFTNGIQEGGL